MAVAEVPFELSGALAYPLRKLVELVAESATFQDWVGVTSQEEALSRVHHPYVPADGRVLTLPRPLAVVNLTNDFRYERVNAQHLRPQGSFDLILQAEEKHPGDPDLDELEFLNQVGGVLADLCALQGQDDRLAIGSIRTLVPPDPPEPEDRSAGRAWWTAIYRVEMSRL